VLTLIAIHPQPAVAQRYSSKATIVVHSTHSSQAHFGCLKCFVTVFKAERRARANFI